MSYINYFTLHRILLFLLLVSALLLIAAIFLLNVNGDEGIIAEHSYWITKVGYVKSKMYDGMGQGWEIRQYHFHKLFVYIGAIFIWIFGISLFALRSISIIFLLLTLTFMYRYSKNSPDISDHRNIFFLSALVLIANFTFLEFGIIFRPETMVMALGFLSFYFLETSQKERKFSLLAISALFAGLSMYTHLNGISFIFAGFVLLAIRKQFKQAFLFGVIASLAALLYFVDILSVTEIKAFWQQFSNDPNLNNDDLLNPFIKLLNEQARFFWNPAIASFTLLTLACLILNFRNLRHRHGNLLPYFLLLVIGLGIFSHGKTLKYGLLYLPFMSLIIGHTLPAFIQSKISLKWILGSLFALFFLVNITYGVMRLNRSFDTVARNEIKSSLMPKKQVNVLGSECLFFNQMENYTLHMRLAFSFYFEKYVKRKPTEEDFYAYARKGNNHYIIADKLEDTQEFLDLIRFESLKVGDINYGYKVIAIRDGFAVMEALN